LRRGAPLVLSLLCLTSVFLALGPIVARAALRYVPSQEHEPFGPDGPGGGTFGVVGSADVAVDQTNGNVYVYDGEARAIYKFDSIGNPVNFSDLGTNVIEGVGSLANGGSGFGVVADERRNQIAVDSSSGHTTLPRGASGWVGLRPVGYGDSGTNHRVAWR